MFLIESQTNGRAQSPASMRIHCVMQLAVGYSGTVVCSAEIQRIHVRRCVAVCAHAGNISVNIRKISIVLMGSGAKETPFSLVATLRDAA